MMVRVGILSDDPIFSEGINRSISGDHTLSWIPLSTHSVSPASVGLANLHVLLIDGRWRGAREMCGKLTRDGGPPIICLALDNDERSALDVLALGVRGILFKSAPPEHIIKAIRVVLDGSVWAPRQLVVAAWLNKVRERSNDALPMLSPALTPREMEVLRHTAAGLGNREVAFTLAISEATVKAHLTSIFQKLGLRGRARLAAAYHGIVNPSPRQSQPRVPLRARLGPTTFGAVVRRSGN